MFTCNIGNAVAHKIDTCHNSQCALQFYIDIYIYDANACLASNTNVKPIIAMHLHQVEDLLRADFSTRRHLQQ